MDNSNLNESNSAPTKRIASLPYRNIAVIGVILAFVIPVVHFIVEENIYSQTIEKTDLVVFDQPELYDTGLTKEIPIIDEILELIYDEPVSQFNNYDYPDWVWSGVLGTSKTTYKSDETVEFIALSIPLRDSGQIKLVRPTGDVFQVIDYDSSENQFYKTEFIPKDATVKKCKECTIGVWKIYLDSDKGKFYPVIYFKVKE